MSELPKPLELVEKIILETRPRVWVAFSIGGTGILVKAMLGRHDGNYIGARSIALDFAQRVVRAMWLSLSHDRIPTPQILVDTTAALLNDPATENATVTAKDKQLLELYCTTWQYVPEGLEICSVGANSVFVFEDEVMREVIVPHSFKALLQSQGKQIDEARGRIPTHALRYHNSCSLADVRVARVPLLPTTTIAIIVDRRLADAMIEQAVPRQELPSFIEAWTSQGKRIRTSVLISFE